MHSIDDLHSALIAMASFLEEHESPYGTEVRIAGDEVGRGDSNGARRYLELNKALLYDVYFSPVNGNAATDAEAAAPNDQFERLHERAYSFAEALLRSGR